MLPKRNFLQCITSFWDSCIYRAPLYTYLCCDVRMF